MVLIDYGCMIGILWSNFIGIHVQTKSIKNDEILTVSKNAVFSTICNLVFEDMECSIHKSWFLLWWDDLNKEPKEPRKQSCSSFSIVIPNVKNL